MAQMKEQSKTPERELRDEEIANLSDGEFKALVIQIVTELIELGWKMKKQLKATQSEIKQNIQGTNGDRKETRTHSNNLEQKEKTNTQPEQNEETRIQKKWRTSRFLGTSGTTLNVPTPELLGCRKEENKSKKLKT